MSHQLEAVNKFKYYFINRFLDSSNKRFDLEERPLMFVKEYFIILLYFLLVIKFFVMLFIDFDYEVRLILFDPSIFIGGIEKFNTFIFFCGAIFGAHLHKMLYLTTSKKLLFWTQLIYLANGSVSPFEFGFDFSDRLIDKKFVSRSKLIFQISNLLILTPGKSFFYKFYFLKFYFDKRNLK